jgi:hypothetical protein
VYRRTALDFASPTVILFLPMTHVRSEKISTVHRKSSCRRGSHRYGTPLSIGAGILRRVCLACGSVSIDVTAAAADAATGELERLET